MPGEDEQGDRRPDGATTKYDTELAEQRFFEEVVSKATYHPLLGQTQAVGHEMSPMVLHI